MEKFKRKVFYLSGFDPRGVRFYHQLHREQVAAYARLTAEDVGVTGRSGTKSSSAIWSVSNATQNAETDYEFLRWEDLVSRAWIRNPVRLILRSIQAYRSYARQADFKTILGLPRGPFITFLYPPVLTLLVPLLLGLIAFLGLLPFLPWATTLGAGILIGGVLSIPLLSSIRAPWLLRFFVFNDELSGRGLDEPLAARIEGFAERVGAALEEPWDEILFVAHSNGSILAVPMLRRLLEIRGGNLPANFTFVTLGHCMPLLACRRDAIQFRDDLRRVAEHDFRWVDLGSPPDGAGYHGVNPMLLVGDRCRPRIELLSPRFHLFYNPETYHKGLRNKYEIHFDYLRIGDRVSPLDYPSITASRRPITDSVALFRAIP